jgi:hypothetical protein
MRRMLPCTGFLSSDDDDGRLELSRWHLSERRNIWPRIGFGVTIFEFLNF